MGHFKLWHPMWTCSPRRSKKNANFWIKRGCIVINWVLQLMNYTELMQNFCIFNCKLCIVIVYYQLTSWNKLGMMMNMWDMKKSRAPHAVNWNFEQVWHAKHAFSCIKGETSKQTKTHGCQNRPNKLPTMGWLLDK